MLWASTLLMALDGVPLARTPAPDDLEVQRAPSFVLWFLGIAGLGLAAYYFPYEEAGIHSNRVFNAYLAGYARMTGAVLGLVDHGVTVAGATISGRFSMQIVRSCDAMEANILFFAAMLAFRAPWRRKALALTAGLAALVGCNVARLVCLYFVGIHARSQFDFAHYEAWPLAMVAFATVDFLLCARWMTRVAPPVAVASGA